ncbi:hypothetical protein ACSFE6_09655 [Pseudomonas baetica]|uniref:hypothetical protein n=1 Tax=Pseudomonas baetica TaxID=674054 RepID=UPI003EEB9856
MKIKYFSYYFKDRNSGKNLEFDMRDFLLNFSLIKNPEYKSTFSYNGENLYLFSVPSTENIFLFLETRNTDFFKQINKGNMTFDDLRNKIDNESELGYASYIVFGEDHFGISSTFMAPGVSPFSVFVNDILASLGINHLDFRVNPVMMEANAKDVMTLNVVGRTSIELSRENTLAQELGNVFGLDISNDLSMDSVEIIFKPTKRGNIKPIVSTLIEKVSGSSDVAVKIRAKEFIKDTLTDFYLSENSAIYDEFSYRTENEIPSLMQKLIVQNKYLAGRLNELKSAVKIEKDPNIAITAYNHDPAWTILLGNLSLAVSSKARSIA